MSPRTLATSAATRWRSSGVAVLLSLLLYSACGARTANVRTVVDGDTVRLDDGESVRLLGIDTPERGEPFYGRARDYLRSRVAGRNVRIEFDHTRRDTYKRLLAYLWLHDTLINEELVRAGLARVYMWPPDTLHFARLRVAQADARSRGEGIWSLEPPSPESAYVIHPERLRFHRPHCVSVRKGMNRVAASRDSLLDLGYSACRTCRP